MIFMTLSTAKSLYKVKWKTWQRRTVVIILQKLTSQLSIVSCLWIVRYWDKLVGHLEISTFIIDLWKEICSDFFLWLSFIADFLILYIEPGKCSIVFFYRYSEHILNNLAYNRWRYYLFSQNTGEMLYFVLSWFQPANLF